MTAVEGNQLISVHDLKFIFELEKPSFCDLKLVNITEHHAAFKAVQHLTDESDAVVRQTLQLQQELACLYLQIFRS